MLAASELSAQRSLTCEPLGADWDCLPSYSCSSSAAGGEVAQPVRRRQRPLWCPPPARRAGDPRGTAPRQPPRACCRGNRCGAATPAAEGPPAGPPIGAAASSCCSRCGFCVARDLDLSHRSTENRDPIPNADPNPDAMIDLSWVCTPMAMTQPEVLPCVVMHCHKLMCVATARVS